VHGTEVVLKHANKKKQLVFIASPSEGYGKSAEMLFREGADREFLALGYWAEKKLSTTCARADRRRHRQPALPHQPARGGRWCGVCPGTTGTRACSST
jgi:hypothetical protein